MRGYYGKAGGEGRKCYLCGTVKKEESYHAYRHQDCGNVTIHLGNFKDIEPDLPGDFDYICFIGVFEYGQSYIGTEDPYVDWLKMMREAFERGRQDCDRYRKQTGIKIFCWLYGRPPGNLFFRY